MTGNPLRIVTYRRRTLVRSQRWGWRAVNVRSGDIVATSGEGYANEPEALRQAHRVVCDPHEEAR